MSMRVVAVLALSFVALTLSACGGGDSREENAEQFKENVAGIDIGSRIEVDDGTKEGVVNGTFVGPDGKSARFWFSFGPEPVDNFSRYDLGDPTSVFRYMGGDGFYAAQENPKLTLTNRQQSRFYDIQFAIEDAACQVVTGEDCKGP